MEKKISFRMESANVDKMEAITKNTGITQTEFINKACAEIPIICLKNSEGLADCMMELLTLIEKEKFSEFREEVDKLCLCLNLLTEEIQSSRSSQRS